MTTIFLVTESEDHDDCSHFRNVKAFTDYRAADNLRVALDKAQDLKNQYCTDVRQRFLLEWTIDNPQPRQEYPDVVWPKWNQKNGKKKGNPLLPEFEAEEARVQAIVQRFAEKHAERFTAWEEKAIAATRALLIEAGMSAEEAATVDTIGSYLYETYREYNVEELELA